MIIMTVDDHGAYQQETDPTHLYKYSFNFVLRIANSAKSRLQ